MAFNSDITTFGLGQQLYVTQDFEYFIFKRYLIAAHFGTVIEKKSLVFLTFLKF